MTEYLRRYNRQLTESLRPVEFDPTSIYRVVGSEESMLELENTTPGQTLAIRTDEDGRGAWLLVDSPSSDIDNWMQIGLGVGITEGTVAAGNDPRFTQLAAALSGKAGTPQVVTSDGNSEIDFGEVVLCNATDGPFSIQLPAPAANKSTFVIHKIDLTTNVVTIEPPSGSTINGVDMTQLGTFLAGVRVICDGQNFWTIP